MYNICYLNIPHFLNVEAKYITCLFHKDSALYFSAVKGAKKKNTSNLLFMEIHAVPVVSQSGILAFPVFQERDGPQRHEHTEEDRARMIEQIAHLKKSWD